MKVGTFGLDVEEVEEVVVWDEKVEVLRLEPVDDDVEVTVGLFEEPPELTQPVATTPSISMVIITSETTLDKPTTSFN